MGNGVENLPSALKLCILHFMGWGEIFGNNSEDMCAEKFPLCRLGVEAEGLACADL